MASRLLFTLNRTQLYRFYSVSEATWVKHQTTLLFLSVLIKLIQSPF